jgi:hypothetical protein
VELSGSKNSSIFKVENVIIDISLDELAIGFLWGQLLLVIRVEYPLILSCSAFLLVFKAS